jgi:4-hydroxyphenylacetate 3-monooxygenase
MATRTGTQYLAGLRDRRTEVWLNGERVSDVTTHPGLAGGARAIAALYDLQCDPEHRAMMTGTCPDTGETTGLSLIIPRTQDDLVRRREMMLAWARGTFAAWAGAADYFGRSTTRWARASRRWTASSSSTTSWCRGIGCSSTAMSGC